MRAGVGELRYRFDVVVRVLAHLCLLSTALLMLPQAQAQSVPSRAAALAFSQPSLAFIPNRGQFPAEEEFHARSAGYDVGLEDGRLRIALHERDKENHHASAQAEAQVFSLELLGARTGAAPVSSEPLAQRNSYFPTGDPKSWIVGVPSFARVAYRDLYPGVDLDFYGREGRLEYDYTLAPGADAGRLRMAIEGNVTPVIDAQGDLVIGLKKQEEKQSTEMRLLRPVAYQLAADGKTHITVAASYRVQNDAQGHTTIGLTLGHYDSSRELIIDPVLAYGEFLPEEGNGISSITADAQGDVYIVSGLARYSPGSTFIAPASGMNIEKLDPTGKLLLDVNFGSGTIEPSAIAIDSAKNIYVTGIASAGGIPATANAYQTSSAAASGNAPFVAVVKADGSALTYASWLTGKGSTDTVNAIAVDTAGGVYIAGSSSSSNFPTTSGAYQAPPASGNFAYVAKFNPTLNGVASLVYATALIGTSAANYSSNGIAVDSTGNAYVAGQFDASFPVTEGAYAYDGEKLTGYQQVYIVKLNPTGSGLVFSSRIGPGSPVGLALDTSGSTYTTGTVISPDFPTTAGAWQILNAYGFATNLSADGSKLVYSTFLANPGANELNIAPMSIAVQASCASACPVYIAGQAGDTTLDLVNPIEQFPATDTPPYEPAFVTELAGNGASALFNTYLTGIVAGVENETGGRTPSIALDSAGNMYVGIAIEDAQYLGEVPATAALGASSTTEATGYVAKISPATSAGPVLATFSLDYSTVADTLTFTPVAIGEQASYYGLQANLVNMGSAPVTLTQPFTFSSPDFTETNNCPATLAGGANCLLTLNFIPSAAGVENATLSIPTSAPNSPTVINLTGTGKSGPSVQSSPSTLSFGNITIGQSSAAQVVTFTNVGNEPATSFAFSFFQGTNAADYSEITNCPATLAVGASCQASITFTPQQVGALNALYEDSLVPGAGVTLTGSGVASSGAAAGTLLIPTPTYNFGSYVVGGGSNPVVLYVTNNGTVPVTINSSSITPGPGTPANDFLLSHEIGTTVCVPDSGDVSGPVLLPPGYGCAFQLSYAPTVAGSESATLVITDTTANSPHTIALSGMGIADTQVLEASPSNYVFPEQPVGVVSGAQTFTFYNLGTVSLTVAKVAISGDFQVAKSTCTGVALPPTGPSENTATGCTIQVTFTPTATGTRTGTLTLTDSAGGSPQMFNLMGTGVTPAGDISVTPSQISFGDVPQGSSGQEQSLSIFNSGNAPVTINSITPSAGFSIPGGAVVPLTLPAGEGFQINVGFTASSTLGPQTGTLTLGTTAGNYTVPLSATAVAPYTAAIGLTPTTFNFGTAKQGTTLGDSTSNPNSQYNVFIRSAGTEAETLQQGLSITGPNAADFSYDLGSSALSDTKSCYQYLINFRQLPSGTSCQLSVSFTPSTTGEESATMTFTDLNGVATSLALSGSGSATQPATAILPQTLAFDLQPVGTGSGVSTSNQVSFWNYSTSPITLQSVSVTSGGADFAIPAGYDTCSAKTTAAGTYCYVLVTFTPSAAGYRTGTLTFKDQNGNTYSSALAGYAPAAINSGQLAPTALGFQPQPINTTNVGAQLLTFTNTGNRQLTVGTLTGTDTIIGSSTTGDFVASATATGTAGTDGCSGKSLAPGASCTLYVNSAPTSLGDKSGSITVPVTYFDGTTASFTATLTGQGAADNEGVSISSTLVSFIDQVAGYPQATNAQIITLTGTSNLRASIGTAIGVDTIVGTSTTGDFTTKSETIGGTTITGYDGCSGATLVQASYCTMTVAFAPTTSGTKTGSISFPITYADGTKKTLTATLTGKALAPAGALTFTPSSINFGEEEDNAPDFSNVSTITVTNSGNIPDTIGADTVSSTAFIIKTDTCAHTTLKQTASCQISIQFAPPSGTPAGPISATLNIADSLPGSPHTVPLYGTAETNSLTVSQNAVNFGSQTVGTTATAQSIYVSNLSAFNLPLTGVVLGGANAADFTETDTCGKTAGTTLGSHGACVITVAFAPAAASLGARAATVTVTSPDAPTQIITLTGTGIAAVPQATLFPTSLGFGSQAVNTTSSIAQNFSISNSGTAPLSITGIASSDPSEFTIASNSCTEQPIAVKGNCLVSVSFTPTAGGARSATITVTDNSGGTAGATQTVAVSGTGAGTTQTITFNALPNVTYGVAPIMLKASASSGLPVTYTVTGAATISGSTLTVTGVGTSGLITVTASQAGNASYAAAKPVSQSFVVMKTPLTVTANNQSISYGQAIPPLTYTVTGLVNGDSAATFEGQNLLITTATSTSAPGSYPIDFFYKTLMSPNYTFNYVSGTLTITGTVSTLPAPMIYPAAGSYLTPQSLIFSDAASGATIHYTTDGSTPTATSPVYSTPIFLHQSETVQAIAVANGVSSTVSTSAYNVSVPGTSFNYPSGEITASQLALNGATVNSGVLQLTDGKADEARSAWFATRVNVQAFVMDFDFQQLNAEGDGFAFVIQNKGATAVGADGGGLGYQGIAPSVAVKFDLYNNAGEGNNSTGLYVNGSQPMAPAIDLTPSGINLHAGHVMHTHLVYDGTNLAVTLTDAVTGATATETYPLNLPSVIGSTSAYVGFTAGTGTATATQNILGWGYDPQGAVTYAAAAPLILPASGNYTTAQQVTMQDATTNGVIHYTLDGTTPTAASPVYSAPLTVPASTVVKAIDISPTLTNSSVSTVTYTNTMSTLINEAVDGFYASALTLNGATITNNALLLSDGGLTEARSAWASTPLPITSFHTAFTFQQLNAVADGLTFTIQNTAASAVGASGGGLGYQGIGKSVAIKFDLYNNAGEGTDSTGLYTDGAEPTLPAIDLSASQLNLHSGDTMQATLDYDGTTLVMTLIDTETGAMLTHSFATDIPSIVGANTAYVGFTAGTGGESATQNILSWLYQH